ncbi:fumarylacetoacetate hydrolase family protein, partial [Lysobacter sp. D1-1-M9]|uniref:fumarylacetoacetate hydrolase family protein n=1 Tax=Novilysobacter longmucuonensis TaxID=3098603 RepID=UPI002FCC9A37
PWDVAKAFDRSAPVSELVVAADVPTLDGLGLELRVNGEVRQQGRFADLIWDVPDILIELSRLFELRAGDVVFMGTPAGVGPLQPGDEYLARLGDVVQLQGRIEHPATTDGTP